MRSVTNSNSCWIKRLPSDKVLQFYCNKSGSKSMQQLTISCILDASLNASGTLKHGGLIRKIHYRPRHFTVLRANTRQKRTRGEKWSWLRLLPSHATTLLRYHATTLLRYHATTLPRNAATYLFHSNSPQTLVLCACAEARYYFVARAAVINLRQ